MSCERRKRVVATSLALLLSVGLVSNAFLPEALAVTPGKQAVQRGVTVLSNDRAAVDTSNLGEGFIMVKYTGGKQVRIKVQIAQKGGTVYTYNLNNAGTDETFPLTEGDGTYEVKVFENVSGTKYAQVYSTSVELKLRDPFLPYLYSNQYVKFDSAPATVAKGAELVKGASSSVDKIQKIFTWVTQNFTYDYELAKNPPVGYLPDVDRVLAAKKGICFDYSAVMAAMLRSQGIPCKLVVGYAGTVYHAWINVYIEGVGWVDGVIYFDGKSWTLMDPTFVSTGKGGASTMKYVTTSSNYVQKYAY